MEDRINEDLICVLKKNDSNQIVKSYLEIVNPLADSIVAIEKLCNNTSVELLEISQRINSFSELKLLNAQYSYCEDLNRPYQGFTADVQKLVNQIVEKDNEIKQKIKEKEEKDYEDDFNAEDEKNKFKEFIKATLLKWSKASAINKAYRRCHEDKSILTFSHRLCGWSNPVYKLTKDFSVEIKTNFGYGNSSYFYTILKYKEIEITPFSEWIEYEFAKFSEINRYTKSHQLENKFWSEAIEFCQKACNLSIKDENEFVQNYILNECEKMVSGLEELFHKEQFSFKKRKTEDEGYTKNIEGHELIEFRGEKISGALDFVSKILEFDQIAQIKSFISRIEDSNRRIKPILIEESEILKVKLRNFDSEMKELSPIYKVLFDRYQNYLKEKGVLRKSFLKVNQITYKEIDESVNKQIDNLFNKKFPEYMEFLEGYLKRKEEYKELSEKIKNAKTVLNKILKYNVKIKSYFEKYKTSIQQSILYSLSDISLIKNELLKRLICVHHPFEKEFIIENSKRLPWGNCLHSDGKDFGANMVSSSLYGLCYNSNIDKSVFKIDNSNFEFSSLTNYDCAGINEPEYLPLEKNHERDCLLSKRNSLSQDLDYLNFSGIKVDDSWSDQKKEEFVEYLEEKYLENQEVINSFEIVDFEKKFSVKSTSNLKYIIENSSDSYALSKNLYNAVVYFLEKEHPNWKEILFVKKETNLDWDFLLRNGDFFNQLFSSYFPFNENELLKHRNILSAGSPCFVISVDSGGNHSSTIFGLIFNNQIEWTNKLKKLYYEEPMLLYAGGSTDEYSYAIDFNKLPLSLIKEVESIQSILDSTLISGYEYSEEEGYYDSLDEELEANKLHYFKVLKQDRFEKQELLNIVKNGFHEFIANKRFYSIFIEMLKMNISDFTVQEFYEKYEKCKVKKTF